MARLAAAMIALLPFHAFVTVWASTFVGHYMLLRLWKELLLAILVLAGLCLLGVRPDLRRKFFGDRLVLLTAAYLALIGIFALFGLYGTVSRKALADGLLLDSRFLFFFLVTWLVTQDHDLIVRLWKQLLLIPAAAVVGLATLQYTLLPHDFLRHFGYGPTTISPTETVDQQEAYTRVQSTLRGANPFGAYLVMVMATLGALVLRRKWWPYAGGFALSCLALFFTFSRSAWLGTLLALCIVIWLNLQSVQLRRILLLSGAAFVLVAASVGYGLRNDDHFQNVFFHTSSHSRSAHSSNQGHAAALTGGLSDIVHQPLGVGLGSAGPASVFNPAPARIAENYFIQIGQELGVVGLGLFIAINVYIGSRLWRGRESALHVTLLASLVGITVVNLLSHAWTDDTLAYIWWGLAGAAVASTPSSASKKSE
jgi:hypothetical protein